MLMLLLPFVPQINLQISIDTFTQTTTCIQISNKSLNPTSDSNQFAKCGKPFDINEMTHPL